MDRQMVIVATVEEIESFDTAAAKKKEKAIKEEVVLSERLKPYPTVDNWVAMWGENAGKQNAVG